MRIAGVAPESIVDGLGIRYVLFTQGCTHNCIGCQNPSTHSFTGGMEVGVVDIAKDILSVNSLDGVTLSGGDPIFQAKECSSLIDILQVNRPHLDYWVYTGFTLEELVKANSREINEFLSKIDILVDGRFILEQRTLDKPFVGSRNQRIIDLKSYRRTGKIVELKI